MEKTSATSVGARPSVTPVLVHVAPLFGLLQATSAPASTGGSPMPVGGCDPRAWASLQSGMPVFIVCRGACTGYVTMVDRPVRVAQWRGRSRHSGKMAVRAVPPRVSQANLVRFCPHDGGAASMAGSACGRAARGVRPAVTDTDSATPAASTLSPLPLRRARCRAVSKPGKVSKTGAGAQCHPQVSGRRPQRTRQPLAQQRSTTADRPWRCDIECAAAHLVLRPPSAPRLASSPQGEPPWRIVALAFAVGAVNGHRVLCPCATDLVVSLRLVEPRHSREGRFCGC